MRTAIVYYSKHHGNTKKLLDAIAAAEKVALIDVTERPDADLMSFDRIGYIGECAKLAWSCQTQTQHLRAICFRMDDELAYGHRCSAPLGTALIPTKCAWTRRAVRKNVGRSERSRAHAVSERHVPNLNWLAEIRIITLHGSPFHLLTKSVYEITVIEI